MRPSQCHVDNRLDNENVIQLLRSTSRETSSGRAARGPCAPKTSKASMEAIGHRTMGLPKGALRPDPRHFLRRRTGERAQSARAHRENAKTAAAAAAAARRPAVPLVCAAVATPFRFRRKNYVEVNALRAMCEQPKSGPTKKPTRVLEMGELPLYLRRIRAREMAAEQSESRLAEIEQERLKRATLSEEQKASILRGLQTNWATLNALYRRISLITDTQAKRVRKERMEEAMDTFEHFMAIIQANPIIVVLDE